MVKEGETQRKIPSKRRKFQKIGDESEDDRISMLPDCVLVEILSRLPYTKDAIRTGTLSKRWEHLWTLLPILVFKHDQNNLPWSDFVLTVDKTLTQCCPWKLKKFVVNTSTYSGFESQVNNWIRYAIRCNVEELDLTLGGVSIEAEFMVDQVFFISSCFTHLTLEGCILNPTGAISWKNLRSLCISNGKLDEDLIENILYGSPLLETLELEWCYGYKRLNITSKSVKKLVVSEYYDPKYFYDDLHDTLEINAPNILSLTIKGDMLLEKLSWPNVFSLVKADLDYRKMRHLCRTSKGRKLKRFILNHLYLKELKIGSFCSKVVPHLEAKGFVVPSNITPPGVTYNWSSESESESESERESEDDSE
ncbi:F-box/LRR-repeat protein 25 [Lactuca sativa]|uniref:F-box domain-containing protein n=1 Tax=Lactuca sativa TaxID=4236 RepID=A0A9R1V2B5_LACSA|nr:F-box/LRR-repeat protein 25 [Lactuca sativa]KAJ0197025.1 hypothetical protein LSAT_V11C700352340 [Lactuca sativa]